MKPVQKFMVLIFLGWTVIGLVGCGGGSGGSSSSTGKVSGNLKIDGIARSGATVSLVSTVTRTVQSVSTDLAGNYNFPAITPGKYYLEYTDDKYGILTSPPAGKDDPQTVTVNSAIELNIDVPSVASPLPPGPPSE